MESGSIKSLKGIGPKTEALFNRIGIYTVHDLLRYYPRDYDQYQKPVSIGELKDGQVAAIEVMVTKSAVVQRVRNLQIISTTVSDLTGSVQVVWYNIPFIKNSVKEGTKLVFRGRLVKKNRRRALEQPEIFTPEAYAGKCSVMQPIYKLTTGLTNKVVVNAVEQSLEQLPVVKEFLPPDLRRAYELAEYNYAIPGIHFPDCMDTYMHARKRLVFEEFFLFTLALQLLKETKEVSRNEFRFEKNAMTGMVEKNLPYTLTNAQKKVWEEIREDLNGSAVMSRLVQGDVGSGKTIIAVMAMIMAVENGYQAALMAPTEVLARQHYEAITKIMEEQGLPFQAELLTGSLTQKQKRESYDRIRLGEARFIIGTHALIQDKVEYENLALVITDEQHRFGVKQREIFSEKGQEPHILVMSATPIPRTLAIIVYGDLDISVIDELPAERIPIKNCVVNTNYRPKAYDFIEKEVRSGRQAYVICPMVEESETLDVENVIAYADTLRQALPIDIQVEFLHGKMKQAEKNEIMERYAAGSIHVLVSTTVIEVGINVPNASVMMVENAERFGLSQLHQLRGRVGRGKHQSYCIFVNGSDSKQNKKRLAILNASNDGFYIASEDLKLRGPGDLFGIRQSGIIEFKIGDIFTDAAVLKSASKAAQEVLKKDPGLDQEEHRQLKKYLDTFILQRIQKLNL